MTRVYHRYTTKQHNFIKEAYTKEYYSVKDLTKDFNELFGTNLTEGQIKGCINRFKLRNRLPPGVKPGKIHSGHFKLGNKPKPNSGQFKPGNIPHNKREKAK